MTSASVQHDSRLSPARLADPAPHTLSPSALQPAEGTRARLSISLPFIHFNYFLFQVLGEDPSSAPEEAQVAALDACLAVNAPLLHRVATKKPLGVLKYAMTLDGKIATAQVRRGSLPGSAAERVGGWGLG